MRPERGHDLIEIKPNDASYVKIGDDPVFSPRIDRA